MPKILIADDNSNIQKMVVLALKDQGIDVVAVGNGEAAVRKISDVRPDLVLADVFMPVRNGYEVCKFVKDNASLSHVPVILLVGAFDPLDEQEAQRVGADGVLKKPFVPPDPLISMVRSALTRSGVSLEGSNAAPPPPPPVAAAPKSEPIPLPKVVPPTAPVLAAVPEEDFVVASTPARAPLSIEPGAQPVAFGNLLDSPVIDEDAVFSISPSTGTVPDRDWSKATAAEEPEEEEEEKTGGWRLGSDEIDAPAGQKDWRETTFGGSSEETAPASAESAPSVEKNSLSISEEEAAALQREQQAFSASIGASTKPDWAKEMVSPLPETQPANATSISEPSLAAKADETVIDLAAAVVTPAEPATEPLANPGAAGSEHPAQADFPVAASADPNPFASSWPAPENHPWEAALNRANELASSWDAVKLTPDPIDAETSAIEPEAKAEGKYSESVPEAAQGAPQAIEIEEPEQTVSAYASESLLSPTVTEELKEEVAQVTETPAVAQTEVAGPQSTPEVVAQAVTPSTDELVAQVLAKMNPEVLQAVTREILKPIVQAMVKEQLEKK